MLKASQLSKQIISVALVLILSFSAFVSVNAAVTEVSSNITAASTLEEVLTGTDYFDTDDATTMNSDILSNVSAVKDSAMATMESNTAYFRYTTDGGSTYNNAKYLGDTLVGRVLNLTNGTTGNMDLGITGVDLQSNSEELYHIDLVYRLDNLYALDNLVVYDSTNQIRRLTKYSVYASDDVSDLFNDSALVATYDVGETGPETAFTNIDMNGVVAEYVAIRFIKIANTSDKTIRAQEIMLFGEKYVPSYITDTTLQGVLSDTEYYDTDDAATMSSDILSNYVPVVGASLNDMAPASGFYRYTSNGGASYGDSSTAKESDVLFTTRFPNLTNNTTGNIDFGINGIDLHNNASEQAYIDFVYRLDGKYNLKNLVLVDHLTSAMRRLTKYSVYASNSVDTLFNQESLIATYDVGTTGPDTAYTNINMKDTEAEYVAIRFIKLAEGCDKNIRAQEVMLFGDKVPVKEPIKVNFADNMGNVVYTVEGFDSVTPTAEQLAEAAEALPLVFGYEFVAWNDIAENVTTDITIKAIFAKSTVDKYNLTLNDGSTETVAQHSFDARITVVPAEDVTGEFDYWKDTVSDTALSNKSEYTFYMPGDISVSAVLDDDEKVAGAKAAVLNTAVAFLKSKNNNYNLYFTGEITLPEGAVLDTIGITYTNSASKIDRLDTTTNDLFNGIASSALNENVKAGPVMMILNNVKPDKTRYAKLYVTYTLNSETITVYSECVASATTPNA